MVTDFREALARSLLRALQPRHCLLAGARDPALAAALLAAARDAGATLHIACAAPDDALRQLRRDGGDGCVLHEAPAAVVAGLLPVPELAWVDADPNHYTTLTVLRAIAAQAARLARPLPVLVVENTGWPHGRRDGYDDPAAIPERFRLPHERAGLIPGQAAPAGASGLLAGDYHATSENEPGNGVLTAVEEFCLAEGTRALTLPGFGGRTLLAPHPSPVFAPGVLEEPLRALAESLDAARLNAELRLAASEAARRRAEGLVAVHKARLTRMAEDGAEPPAPPTGRLGRVVRAMRSVPSADPDAAAADRLRASPIFDAAWYLSRYQDVAEAGLDPVLHYLRSGADELRDPGPHFSTGFYWGEYRDVAEAGMNPLLHYLAAGASEGRNPSPEFDSRRYAQDHGLSPTENPLEHCLARNPR